MSNVVKGVEITQSAVIRVNKTVTVPQEKVDKWRKIQMIAAGSLALVGIAALIAGAVLKAHGFDLGDVGNVAFLVAGFGVVVAGGIVGDDALRKVPILFAQTHRKIDVLPEHLNLVKTTAEKSYGQKEPGYIASADRIIPALTFGEDPYLLAVLKNGFSQEVTTGLSSFGQIKIG